MIEPEVDDHVYTPQFGLVGRITQRKGEWCVIDLGDGTAALRKHDVVAPSRHAQMRWRQRMWAPGDDEPSEAEELVRRWAAGVVLPDNAGVYGDEARADPETGAVLALQENAIATVIDRAAQRNELAAAVEEACG